MKQFMKRLFPQTLWNRDTTTLWGCTFLQFILFDIIWCLQTTFSSFSILEVYVNSALMSLLFILPFMLTGKKWVQYLVLFILDGLLISNLMYSRTYNSAIPLESYLLAGNLSDFTASVVDSMRLIDILLPLSTLTSIILLYKRGHHTHAFKSTPKPQGYNPSPKAMGSYGLRLKQYACTLLVMLLISAIQVMARGGWQNAFTRLQNANYYTCAVPMYTIFGNLAHEATQQDAPFTSQMQAEIDRWEKEQPQYVPLSDSLNTHSLIMNGPDSTGIAKKKTLIVIFCESLESWVINRKVEGKEITPNLNRYIADRHTLYAPHVLTQVKGGRSIDGQLLVNAGILPLMNGCYAMLFPETRYPSLAWAMKDEHKNTKSYLMTVDKPVTWNQGIVARDFGIDSLFCNDSWINDEKVGTRKKLGDVSFMKQIVKRLKSSDILAKGQSTFLQIVTYSGHNPFVLPDNLKRIHFKGDYPEKMRDYMTMANYTDHGLGILLDYLKSRPDYKDMMIVMIGDHEGLAADRKPICSSPAAKGIVSDKQFTPFIVVNAPVGGIYNKVLGQIDQYPTILNLMRLDHYPWKGMGQSILDPRKYPAAVGSDHMNVETTGKVPEKEIKRLTEAHRIADLLIKYDKIIKK